MKSRWPTRLAVVLAGVAVGVAVGNLATHRRPHRQRTPPRPALASYLGVFEPGSPPTMVRSRASASWRAGTGSSRGITAAGRSLSTRRSQRRSRHGVISFVQIDPTGRLDLGDRSRHLRRLPQLIRRQRRDFGHAVVIGSGHEMNASWYSWGYTHVPAATFVAAWRHIVTLFRKEGADNVTWLWTLEADQPGTGPIASWWPGAQYVTWVGIDGYYQRSSDTFTSVFRQTIAQVRAFTSKPVLLSETAVTPRRQPVRQYPGPVPRDGHVQDARAGVVRQDPARQHFPPELEARGQPAGWFFLPAGRK